MKKVLLVLLSISLISVFTACGSSEEKTEETQAEETQTGETHIYDNAEIVTEEPAVLGSDKTWTYSIIEAPSDEITDDVIEDWYFNFCKPHSDEYNWNIILYTDKPDMGVYENNGLIQINTYIEQDENGYYRDSDKDEDIQATYMWEEDGKLVVMAEAGEE